MSVDLEKLRDLLSPGLWNARQHDLKIEVDHVNDRLIVGRPDAYFTLPRRSIESGSYKAEFKPSVDALIKTLESKK